MGLIKNWFGALNKKFVSKHNYSLEEKIFRLVTISGILMSTVGLFGNISLGLGVITFIILSINIIIDVICIVYFQKTRKWEKPSIIVILYGVFILFPTLWFSTGGATGSTMPFVVLMGIFIVIAFNGRFRAICLIVVIIMYLTFTLLELRFPDLSTPYQSRDTHYADLAIGMFLSYCVSVYLAYQVLTNYKKSKHEAELLVKQLELSSILDPLTGIYNRRYLTSAINDEMRKAYDDGSELVLCIFDIDFFKKINDTYGHNYGDRVLVELSKCIGDSLDSSEVFGRYGGEEFLIIFKDCGLDKALVKMNMIYHSIERMQVNNSDRITISSGMSVYYKGISFSNFLESADKNLYKAKENGRSQIVY